jgi:hypothetical protein
MGKGVLKLATGRSCTVYHDRLPFRLDWLKQDIAHEKRRPPAERKSKTP